MFGGLGLPKAQLQPEIFVRCLTPDQAADTLEVIEDRTGLRSTIVTSQLPITMWHQAITEATIADAVMDRLLNNLHRIELTGESMRRNDPTQRPSARTQPASEETPTK